MGKNTGRSRVLLFAIVVLTCFLCSCPLGVDLLAELETAVKEGTNPKRTLVVDSGPYGSVNRTGSLSVIEEIPTEIQATPDPGLVFFRWEIVSGESNLSSTQPLTEADNSFTLVGGDAEIRAVFTDPVMPGVPGIPCLDESDDSGVSGIDGVTNTTASLTVKGAWPDGSVKRVELYEGSTLLGSASTAIESQYVIDVSLAEGQHSIAACAVNLSDVLSEPSTACAITVDTTPPAGSLDVQFYYVYDANNRNPLYQFDNPWDANNPKPAGWQNYVESPNPTADVRLTIAASDANGVVGYSLDQGSGFSETPCGAYPVTRTCTLTNKYDNVGHTYRIKLMDTAGNWTGDNDITDSIRIAYCFKLEHQFYYIDLDGDSSGTGEIWWTSRLEIEIGFNGFHMDRLCFYLPSIHAHDGDPMSCDNTYLVRDDTVTVESGFHHPSTDTKINYSYYVPSAFHTYVFYYDHEHEPYSIYLFYQVYEDDGIDSEGKDDFALEHVGSDLADDTGSTTHNRQVLRDPYSPSGVTGDLRFTTWTNK